MLQTCSMLVKSNSKKQNKNANIWLAGIIYFVVIPFVLVVVYLTSNILKDTLFLYPQHPTFLSVLGSNYVHTTFVHFISNLVFYLMLMAFIFTFDALTNKKMLFVNLPLLFIVLPIVSSVCNILVFTYLGLNVPSKGFSAVVAGVFGYLGFSTLHFIKYYYEVKFDKNILQLMWSIFYINVLIISLVYGYYFAVAVIAVLVVISIVYTQKDIKKIFLLLRRIKRSAQVLLFVSFYLCLFVGVIGLFPGSIVVDKTVVNIYAHYVGYIFGFFVPALVSIYIVEKK
jgi:hypothetical protein